MQLVVIQHLELDRETAGMIMIDSTAFVYPPLQCMTAWLQNINHHGHAVELAEVKDLLEVVPQS